MDHNFESYQLSEDLSNDFNWEELKCSNCNLILYKEFNYNSLCHRFILNNKVIEIISILYYSTDGCDKCYFNDGQTKFSCEEIIIKNIIE